MLIGRSRGVVLLAILVGALPLLVAACGEPGPTLTPSPTATVAATPTPTASPTPESPVAGGQALYLAKGCAGCHGQDAQGTAFAPALPGRNVEQVQRQVRNPVGNMPAFSQEALSDEELDAIIAYIQSLAASAEATSTQEPPR